MHTVCRRCLQFILVEILVNFSHDSQPNYVNINIQLVFSSIFMLLTRHLLRLVIWFFFLPMRNMRSCRYTTDAKWNVRKFCHTQFNYIDI